MVYISFFSDETEDSNLLGGKGSNLVKLVKIGMNVPPGFVVTTNSYGKFLEESANRDQLKELLSKQLEPKNIMQDSKKINELILDSQIPSEIVEEIRYAYNKICERLEGEVSFAVRSSATVEDSAKFSFAGQADSFLYNKTFEDILISLKKCWASLFSPRALLYFLQMKKQGVNIPLSNVQMAVVVQKMVNSEVSGVMFTANVINNDESQIMINSTWGLGGPIADNSVIPDMIILNKANFDIIRRTIGDKEKKSIQNPDGSGTIFIDMDPQSRSTFSLNEEQLRQLHSLGLKLEQAFKCPQDIELAIDNNVIYTLQTRPITTLKKQKGL